MVTCSANDIYKLSAAVLSLLHIFCLQDAKMDYTGTRYTTTFRDGYYQLTSAANAGFVSNRLNDTVSGQTAPFSNAGELHWWSSH